jgi:perosamine synthetase
MISLRRLTRYMSRGGLVTESRVTKQFEEELASFTGAAYCFMTPNSTLGLSLALSALGVGPGDKVLVPTYSMVASAHAVRFIGACPVF